MGNTLPDSLTRHPAYEAIRDAAAEQMHEANRAWCHDNGDDSQKPWASAQDWQKEASYKTFDRLLANPTPDPVSGHVAWSKDKTDAGWVYGSVKDDKADPPTHPDLVDYSQLSPVARAKDSIQAGVALGARAVLMALGLLPR